MKKYGSSFFVCKNMFSNFFIIIQWKCYWEKLTMLDGNKRISRQNMSF